MFGKLFHKKNRWIWLCLILSLVLGVVFYPQLPDKIPTHFGPTGQPDDYGGRETIFLFTGFIFAEILLAEVARFMDPKRENIKKFESVYYHFFTFLACFFLVFQAVVIAISLGKFDKFPPIMEGLLGILFIFIGNIMPKLKHNYMMGIRTPWTLANENVWYLTHRLIGKIWVVMGIIMLGIGFLPSNLKAPFLLTLVFGSTLIAYLASYLFYRKIEKAS